MDPSLFRESGAQQAGINKIRDLAEQMMLFDHLRCLVQRRGEHQFPVHRNALAFEANDIENARVVDQRQPTVRRNGFRDGWQVLVGRSQARDIFDLTDADLFQPLGLEDGDD